MSFFNPTQTNRNYIENYGLDSSTDYGINIYKQIGGTYYGWMQLN